MFAMDEEGDEVEADKEVFKLEEEEEDLTDVDVSRLIVVTQRRKGLRPSLGGGAHDNREV